MAPAAGIQIALLRAVNIGSHGKVSMDDLRALMKALRLADGRTLLQSGNLIFRGEGGPALERRLETESRKRLGLETDFFVRSAAEWAAIVDANPFAAAARTDPGHLVVLFLKDPVDPAAVTALQAAISGREQVRAGGRALYFTYPDGIGRSRLTNVFIEKRLGTRGTGRNWNTVLKLHALAQAATG